VSTTPTEESDPTAAQQSGRAPARFTTVPNSRDPALDARLQEALNARGPRYRPRAQHRAADGSPLYTNRLILETSPYLLQHAHNPVDWFPWGDEAFEKAARERKPVFLSVGYSSCHWCHVMERESFEDEEIARELNEHWVSIKVDREERPDVDDLYMKAVQVLTNHGGWPMTVFLTPERQPFFAGTYFPPRDGPWGAGFLTVLKVLRERYARDPLDIARRASAITASLKDLFKPARPTGVPGAGVLNRAKALAARVFDPVHGGFGGPPKFPQPSLLDLLLRVHRRTGDPEDLRMVVWTLDRMAAGGIHDVVGGGFHRYATDSEWQIPHYERMLYDNALLAMVYLAASRASGRPDLAEVARGVLEWMDRDLSDPSGCLHSATDADSPTADGESAEGGFFTWTRAEVERAAGDAARFLWAALELVPGSDGRGLFRRIRGNEEAARTAGIESRVFEQGLRDAIERLRAARELRPPPARDDKVIAAWNGLALSAFARGGFVLADERLARRAVAIAEGVMRDLCGPDGRLYRTVREGRRGAPGFLEDHAFLIQGLLDLAETDPDLRWIDAAIRLQGLLDQGFWDEEAGGYFRTGREHESLWMRDKPFQDWAEPSGNSVAAMNLLRLHELTGREAFRQKAHRVFSAFAADIERSPLEATQMLCALDFALDRTLAVVIVTPAGTDPKPLWDVVRGVYLPNRVLMQAIEGPDLERKARLVPLLERKSARDGRPTAYVCERGRCEAPTSDPATLLAQLTTGVR